MARLRKAIAVVTSAAFAVSTMGLDGCKKESKGSQDQAPTATSAAPTAEQLYQLVAPIALFPDNLIAQVLAASTYPDQVTEAWNWLQQNKGQQAQQLMQAVNQQSWDVSVKGLTQFPDVMQQMAGNLSWTSALGDAYYNSPQNVMNAVQVMRQRAYQAGNLKTTPQQNVSVQNEQPAAEPAPASSGDQQVTVVQSPPQTIVIQPSQPDVVYVPSYNPTVVYGAPVPAYPGYSTGDMVATGLISFGLGMAVGAAMSGGCCGWGWNSWGCGWHNSSVTYNRNVYVSNSNTFANRTNYNRNNVNNINRNNINRNDINRNNRNGVGNNRNDLGNNRNGVGNNRNDLGNNRNGVGNNRNDIGRNNANRGGDFGNSPKFDSSRNQQQFRDQGRSNNAGQRTSAQPTANQRDRSGMNQASQQRASQNNRQAVRGYGDQASRGNSSGGLGSYGQGGNARADSARGQQSLNGGANRAASSAPARSSGGGGNFGGGSGGGGGGGRGGGGGGNRGGSRGGGRR
jgi:hypothetical protein